MPRLASLFALAVAVGGCYDGHRPVVELDSGHDAPTLCTTPPEHLCMGGTGLASCDIVPLRASGCDDSSIDSQCQHWYVPVRVTWESPTRALVDGLVGTHISTIEGGDDSSTYRVVHEVTVGTWAPMTVLRAYCRVGDYERATYDDALRERDAHGRVVCEPSASGWSLWITPHAQSFTFASPGAAFAEFRSRATAVAPDGTEWHVFLDTQCPSCAERATGADCDDLAVSADQAWIHVGVRAGSARGESNFYCPIQAACGGCCAVGSDWCTSSGFADCEVPADWLAAACAAADPADVPALATPPCELRPSSERPTCTPTICP